jgi:hypothetical protein
MLFLSYLAAAAKTGRWDHMTVVALPLLVR